MGKEKIIKETKYLRFVLVEKKLKTNKYNVVQRKMDEILGTIEWYNYWRQYVFEPDYDRFNCIFNDTCLAEMAEFIKDLNIKHKEKKNQGF